LRKWVDFKADYEKAWEGSAKRLNPRSSWGHHVARFRRSGEVCEEVAHGLRSGCKVPIKSLSAKFAAWIDADDEDLQMESEQEDKEKHKKKEVNRESLKSEYDKDGKLVPGQTAFYKTAAGARVKRQLSIKISAPKPPKPPVPVFAPMEALVAAAAPALMVAPATPALPAPAPASPAPAPASPALAEDPLMPKGVSQFFASATKFWEELQQEYKDSDKVVEEKERSIDDMSKRIDVLLAEKKRRVKDLDEYVGRRKRLKTDLDNFINGASTMKTALEDIRKIDVE
jgi:hypothetical protein